MTNDKKSIKIITKPMPIKLRKKFKYIASQSYYDYLCEIYKRKNK